MRENKLNENRGIKTLIYNNIYKNERSKKKE
jgi:hypothetical protein